MTHHIDLATIHLDMGAKASYGDDRGCLLEWTARFAGLDVIDDHPSCTSPVLAAFGIAWNDALDDERRMIDVRVAVPA